MEKGILGPHEGKELELMLRGEKQVALFNQGARYSLTPFSLILSKECFIQKQCNVILMMSA